ncbi:MAG: hypothetical protein ACNA7V_05375 [Bacteroidales bacterium]
MSSTLKSVFLWIFSILFTLSLAIYQRMTGPTHPVRGSMMVEGQNMKYRLIRSSDSDKPAEIRFRNAPEGVEGTIRYKRFKVDEEWMETSMKKENGSLTGYLPPEPPAGKIEYLVTLTHEGQTYEINEVPVVIRFKGPVPAFFLWPHILFMFFAMLLSTRTGLEAIFNRKQVRPLAFFTVLCLGLGGLVLGPFVQKYAFGDYWTGWPFGGDMTDNKTLVAFLFWLIAYLRLMRNKPARIWVITASVVLLAIYLIPHSMFGSELDYTTGEVTTGK